MLDLDGWMAASHVIWLPFSLVQNICRCNQSTTCFWMRQKNPEGWESRGLWRNDILDASPCTSKIKPYSVSGSSPLCSATVFYFSGTLREALEKNVIPSSPVLTSTWCSTVYHPAYHLTAQWQPSLSLGGTALIKSHRYWWDCSDPAKYGKM